MKFWIQAIGIVAMATNISAYQFKSKRGLLLCLCMGSALFSVNLFLLGAVTGAIMNVLSVVRSLVYVKMDRLPISVRWVNIMFIAAYLISYVLSFTVFGIEPTVKNFILELLPIIAMSAMTIAFADNNAKIIRLSVLYPHPAGLSTTYSIMQSAASFVR